jgi:hypothetical protein
MTKFKIQDSNGNRFTVYAKDRKEAMQKAKRQSNANVIYIL